MKIILDDRRYVPSNSPYNVVRNYEDCVEMIRLFRKISYISLDYNLGIVRTGCDVLVYIKENDIGSCTSTSTPITPWMSP